MGFERKIINSVLRKSNLALGADLIDLKLQIGISGFSQCFTQHKIFWLESGGSVRFWHTKILLINDLRKHLNIPELDYLRKSSL